MSWHLKNLPNNEFLVFFLVLEMNCLHIINGLELLFGGTVLKSFERREEGELKTCDL